MSSSIDAVAYYLSCALKIDALKYIPSNLVFIISRLQLIPVVLFSLIFLGEELTPEFLTALEESISLRMINKAKNISILMLFNKFN